MGHSESGSNLSVSKATLSDLSGHGANAGSIIMKNASAHGNPDLTQSGFNVAEVAGDNLTHEQGNIGNVSLSDISGSRNNNSYQASIATVSANDANLRDLVGAQSIYGTNASVSANIGEQTTYNANLDQFICSRDQGRYVWCHSRFGDVHRCASVWCWKQ